MAKKIVFLDRDGVINRCAAEHEYIRTWNKFEFLSGAKEAIRLLNKSDCLVIVVSNQRGVARGMFTMEVVNNLHRQMQRALQAEGAHIDAIYVCPHEIGACHCRKPDIGLFLQAEQEYFVDKAASWMIGDSETDIQAGKSYGVKTALIGQGKFGQDMTCGSLLEATKAIVGENK